MLRGRDIFTCVALGCKEGGDCIGGTHTFRKKGRQIKLCFLKVKKYQVFTIKFLSCISINKMFGILNGPGNIPHMLNKKDGCF